NMVRISYKGGGPALNDVLAGQVKIMFATTGSVMPHVKSGRLRALAVTSADPTPLVPGLPAIAATVPGYESLTFCGLFVPAKTPSAIIARLNETARKYLELPEAKERFGLSGVEAVSSTQKDFDAAIKTDTARIQKLIQATGIRAE
ncbi:MAG TPA: tripartite tricarboxylate transporter substrate-binding protein, partial [Terriglobales bacterium]|nr:tripartite tricarboxylate transporter substrate-binding protein [Terriglobales bacterium]